MKLRQRCLAGLIFVFIGLPRYKSSQELAAAEVTPRFRQGFAEDAAAGDDSGFWLWLSGVLGFRTGVAVHFSGPLQEPDKLAFFSPHETAKLKQANAVHLDSGVGFDSPAKVWAAPRSKSVAPSRVPQESEDVAHR